MNTEYNERMEALASIINANTIGNVVIGIRLDPPIVEWASEYMMKTTSPAYDGLFFVESLMSYADNDADEWSGESLAEYLETLTREFVSENQGEN